MLVIDNAGKSVSTFGGLATLAAKTRGLAGVIVDGGVRDREEMEEQRLPVFARHMTPLTGRTRIALSAINAAVSCGGVRVRPGDVIVADGSRRGLHPGRARPPGCRAGSQICKRRCGCRSGARTRG